MDNVRYRNTYLTKATRQAFEMIARKVLVEDKTNADAIIEGVCLEWLEHKHPELVQRISKLHETQSAMETEILNSLK